MLTDQIYTFNFFFFSSFFFFPGTSTTTPSSRPAPGTMNELLKNTLPWESGNLLRDYLKDETSRVFGPRTVRDVVCCLLLFVFFSFFFNFFSDLRSHTYVLVYDDSLSCISSFNNTRNRLQIHTHRCLRTTERRSRRRGHLCSVLMPWAQWLLSVLCAHHS